MKQEWIGKLTANRVRIALLLLALALLLSCAVTYAWYGANRKVDSEGLELGVEKTGNLVISDSQTELAKTVLGSINTDSPFRVVSSETGMKFTNATHAEDYLLYPTGLKTVTNWSVIGVSSGINETGSIVYADAENETDGPLYYVDFPVYIASHGKPLTEATLTAEIISATIGDTPVTSGSLMALSVDFYRNEVDADNFIGTLNVAGFDADANDFETEKKILYVVGSDSSTGTIPINTAATVIKLVLRCYVDGALLSGENQAFINSADLDLSQAKLNIRFTADGIE